MSCRSTCCTADSFTVQRIIRKSTKSKSKASEISRMYALGLFASFPCLFKMDEDEAAGTLSLSLELVINAGMRTRSHSLTRYKDRGERGTRGGWAKGLDGDEAMTSLYPSTYHWLGACCPNACTSTNNSFFLAFFGYFLLRLKGLELKNP